MKTTVKKILALVLSLALCLSVIPTLAVAEEPQTEVQPEITESAEKQETVEEEQETPEEEPEEEPLEEEPAPVEDEQEPVEDPEELPEVPLTRNAPASGVSYLSPVYNTDGVVTSGLKEMKNNTLEAGSYTVIKSTSMPTTLGTAGNTTWYVVEGTVSYSTGITVNGAVHLILTDDCSMTVQGAEYEAGICVSGDGNSLAIYGQTNGTGKLETTGGKWGAGIGGGYKGSGSNITVNGGSVTAKGGKYGAGIGGGDCGSGSNITINGGTVTVTGGDFGAGIGGGDYCDGGTITVNGGSVTANGGKDGAGIGGGDCGSCNNVTVNGGTVTANGAYYCAGIGGAYGGSGSDITINGGTVTANGGYYGAGIGGGCYGSGKNITVNGGDVMAYGEGYGAGIGGGNYGSGSNITVNDGTVTAKGGYCAAGIGGSWEGSGSNITVNGGTVTANGGDYGAGIGGGAYGRGSDINVNDGSVTANGGESGAGIGGGYKGSGSSITIDGGAVTATGGKWGAGIGGGEIGSGTGITVSGGYINATGKDGAEDIGNGVDAASDSEVSLTGGFYANEPDADKVSDSSLKCDNPNEETKDAYPYAVAAYVTRGNDQHVTHGLEWPLSFTSPAEFDEFLFATLNGEVLDEDCYTVKEGSTILTLKSEFVATLDVGEYVLQIVSEQEIRVAYFTVRPYVSPSVYEANFDMAGQTSMVTDRTEDANPNTGLSFADGIVR